MYESPVNLIVQDIETQMVQKEEQMILEAIRKCDVVVNKEELIKAINYDRNQYTKGYKDGVSDVLNKIMAEIEDLTYYCWEVSPRTVIDDVLKIIDKYKEESE